MSSFLTYTATVPSNIAIIKYWGKRDAERQIPANDSLSLTLKNTFTYTSARLAEDEEDHEVFYRDEPVTRASDFGKKIFKQLDYLQKQFPQSCPLHITTRNSFPDSCGIASSASGLGALTLAAVGAWTQSPSLEDLAARGFGPSKLANLARMGSGSASRSFFSGLVHWQVQSDDTQKFSAVQPPFALCDVVVLVSTERKAITSSKAHTFVWDSPLFAPRLAGLPERIGQLKDAVARGDFARFGEIAESDCLEMHSVMMTGKPPVQFWQPATIEFISWVRNERGQGRLPAYFTIDAGPNVHLLCEKSQLAKVTDAVSRAYPKFELLVDEVGQGPVLTVQ